MRAPAPPTEEFAARSNKAPGTATLPWPGMSRRSPNPTSCAATASAHVGQGHHTRTRADYRTRSGRPPPLTRRPLPCRALVDSVHAHRSTAPVLALYRATRVRRDTTVARLTVARKIGKRAFHALRELELASA
jgi:hypothetical protein